MKYINNELSQVFFFSHMNLFRNGAMIKKYEGDKSLDALKAFVKKMAAKKPAKTAAKKAGKKKSTAKTKKQEL